jgi:formylglycine-generating enzyme required for sulfatase activity
LAEDEEVMMSTFISYSRADSAFAVRLARDLKSAGFDVWLDQLDIPTGARWDDEVETALESCKTFMIVLSPESLQSQNVKDEVGYAIDAGKDILPLKLKSGDIPFRLRRFQYVDFSKQSYNESLKEIKGILSAAGQVPTPRATGKEPSESEAQATQKRIKAATAPSVPRETKPALKTPESTSSPVPRKSTSRGFLIGVAVVAMLAIAGVVWRTLGAEKSPAATPSNETPVAETPTEQTTAEPTSDNLQVSGATDPGTSGVFLTKFTESKSLENWEDFVIGLGRKDKVNVSQSKDGLVFHLDDPDLHAYYTYTPEIYSDVIIRMKAENLGQNTYKVSLVCRRNDDNWYEFTVLGGGLWQFYDYNDKYIPLVNGGTQAVKPGRSTNEYEMRCMGNEASLSINGQEVTTYHIRKNTYAEGQVGFAISSSTVFPIDMKVLDFEIVAGPSSGSAVASTSSPNTVSAVKPGQENTRLSQKDGMTMVFVPEGEFTMGSNEGEPNERPVHTVFTDAFWIDRTEVTNLMYATFLNSQKANSNLISDWLDVEDHDLRVHLVGDTWQVDPGYENHPVIEMRWIGASAYCEWRGEGTRLPTEAEWEKAARGTTNFLYAWGNEIDCKLANYAECVGGTVEVGSYPANVSPFGALDMTGNVVEWVADWYDENYYQSSPSRNPTGPNSGQQRVLRGGSWDGYTDYQVRSTFRFLEGPDESKDDAGFRCVLPE